MTGCITLLSNECANNDACVAATQSLRHGIVYQVPGDMEAVRSLRLAADPIVQAQCVLVVEKDSVFRRLIDDGLVRRLPSVLITGCG